MSGYIRIVQFSSG